MVCLGLERCMVLMRGRGMALWWGFCGDVAKGKYSARESAFINSFRENKPPILIGFLR